jgi:hypothetical protein
MRFVNLFFTLRSPLLSALKDEVSAALETDEKHNSQNRSLDG